MLMRLGLTGDAMGESCACAPWPIAARGSFSNPNKVEDRLTGGGGVGLLTSSRNGGGSIKQPAPVGGR